MVSKTLQTELLITLLSVAQILVSTPRLDAPPTNEESDMLEGFAFMVSLRESQGKNFLCGGTIIHKDYILISSSCINNVPAGLEIVAVAGQLNLKFTENSIFRKVTHIENNKDISILKLEDSFDLDHPYVSSIALEPEKIDRNICFVSGWGDNVSGVNIWYENIANAGKISSVGTIICDDYLRSLIVNKERSTQRKYDINLHEYSAWINSVIHNKERNWSLKLILTGYYAILPRIVIIISLLIWLYNINDKLDKDVNKPGATLRNTFALLFQRKKSHSKHKKLRNTGKISGKLIIFFSCFTLYTGTYIYIFI